MQSVAGSAIFLALCAVTSAVVAAPPVEFTTDEAFDAGAVAAYGGRHDAVYRHIDASLPEHLAALQRWVRQPSVSAQNRGIAEMAQMLAGDLTALGFEDVVLVPTSGHPGVFGYYDAGAPRSLAVYMMYDVQPEETGWQVDAFEGALLDTEHGRVLMARGATNQKGPQRAFLNAVASILAVDGRLPVNLLVVAEGEEELGSPHFGEVIDRYADRLATADGVLFPANTQAPTGEATFSLGVKGIVVMELEARGTPAGGPQRAEIHSSLKAVVDAPAWRLVQALASLTSADGNEVRVSGFYDGIRAPTVDEQRLVNAMAKTSAAREAGMRRSLAVDRFVDGATGRDLLARLLFTSTLNIDGLWSGYTGEGLKTILPHVARARLDARLVPDQQPDAVVARVRAHLDAKGFDDVVVRKISGYPPAQTDPGAPVVRTAISVFNKWGRVPEVAPRLAGSAPYYLFTERLKLPLLSVGLGHGSGAHAPNEYMVIEPTAGSNVAGLADVEKFYADVLFALAAD